MARLNFLKKSLLMLRIHASHTNAVKSGYYENGLANEGDYYLNKSLQATWRGEGSKILGIEGKAINREDFQKLADNKNPLTNERLNVRHSQNRRVGWDMVFSAPKSVSLLWGITKNDEILEAHRKANGLTMQAIEKDAYTQANTKYERGYNKTSNLIYGSFHHHTSRPTKERGKSDTVIDMQLHTHNFVMNSTYCHQNLRFQAMENHHIIKSAPLYEAMYHSHLSKELNKLGYTTQRTPNRFEVVGVSQDLINRFSTRTRQIEQASKEKGITDAKAKAELGAKTRLKKDAEVNESDLFNHWKNRVSKNEYDQLQNVKGSFKAIGQKITPKQAIDKSLNHHLERNSTAPTKAILAHALKLSYGQLIPKDVEDELKSRENILKSEFDTIEYLTTKEMVAFENKMIEDAANGKGVLPALHKDYKPKQTFLNDDQKKAIKELLSSQDRVTILSGSAGVGKTSLLTEVRDGVQAKKKSLFAVAPSTQAAKVLKEKRFDSDTIAALLTNPKLEEKLKNQCLLVDEAGMVGVEQMSKIMEMAKRNNTRVYLSGDTLQHGPPGQYGDALRILQEKANLKNVKVKKIVRQKPEKYRKAIEEIANGNHLEGYKKLDKMRAIKEIPYADLIMQTLAYYYSQSLKQKRTALIISP
ncbi:MAG: MobF family relaxase, partial [Chloroflexota bacterium]